MKLLYLVSAPYSGSTLVCFLLGRHVDIATVGELSGPDPNVKSGEHQCSCGALTARCPFWQKIQRRLAQKGVTYSILDQDKRWRCSRNRLVHLLLTRPNTLPFVDKCQSLILKNGGGMAERVAEFLDRNYSVMREISAYYKARVFLDTSKDIDRVQVLRRSHGLEVRVLHLVRDGHGQTNSKVKRGATMAAAARSLVRFDSQALRLRKLLGDESYLRVRYEDICRAPEMHFGRIAEFVGLDPGGFPDGFEAEESHVLGNPMRFAFKGQIELDERWKTDLSDEQLAVFNRIAGGRNKRFAYEIM